MKRARSRGRIRFAALLLFQFRVVVGGRSVARRRCELRMINLGSRDAKSALAKATKHGRAEHFSYRNVNGDPVYFEFVGVLDMIALGSECGPDEVWYDIIQLHKPMERRKQLVPPARRLAAFSSTRPNNRLKLTARGRPTVTAQRRSRATA